MNVKSVRIRVYPRNLEKMFDFYENILGLKIQSSWQEDHSIGKMYDLGNSGSIEVVKFLKTEKKYNPENGANISLEVENIESLWEGLKDKAAVLSPLKNYPWKESSFSIIDPEGLEIGFYKKII